MFSSFYKKPFFNKALSEYCFQSTLNSIQKIIEKLQLERKLFYDNNNKKLNMNTMTLFKNPDSNQNNNPYFILALIPFIYFFCRSERKILTY